MGVKLYIEVKKNVPRFDMYPLCISTIDKDERKILFKREIVEVMCLEGANKEGLALTLIHSEILEA